MAEPESTAPEEKPGTKDAAFVKYWTDQLAAYDDEFEPWKKRCKKIIRRYRDERQADSNGTPQPAGARFNALWSNVQTLQPAIYLKPPQPVAERRYLDKDPLARISSMTLERALEVQIEVGYLHPSMQKAVLDYLLCGRGSVWERYEPTYGAAEDLGGGVNDEEPRGDASGVSQGGLGDNLQQRGGDNGYIAGDPREGVRPVTYEKVCTDYVAWDKFKHSPSPVWEEVWWVAKEEMLTRKELRARFKAKDPETGKPIADLVPLRDGSKDKENDREKKKRQPRACVVEIWDKSEQKVIFIAPDWSNAPLEVTDDPLKLETFWPCPKPLYATTTNDCLVPVPDYVEYQDQADELDDLTGRIKALTDAVRVNGVYDASYPELKRILSEGADNRMIGVKNYSEFASKGGLEAAMDFVPIKDVVEALIRLYEARDRVKADMAEITGLSDIIRGQAQGTAKTATEQRIKGQFASLRLEDRKKEVARFACDAIRIAAEIISEQFSPEILAEMTGMLPFIVDELKAEAPPLQPAQQPMMGHNGGPPMAEPGVSPPPGDGAAGGMPSAPGQQPPDFNALAQKRFFEACELLKNDKMRTFRIDIETDSTVEVDKQAAKESVVEMFTAVGGFLEKSVPIAQTVPQLMPALGQSVLFAFRRFGAGRDVEGVWEQAIEQLTQASKNPAPKPPSPEEIKAQAEKQKAELNAQSMQQKAALDKQKGEQDIANQQQKAAIELQKGQNQLALDREKLQLERERMEFERQKMGLEIQATQAKAVIEADAMERDAALSERAAIRDDEFAERAAERDAEAGEHEFELGEKVREAKAKEAMKPKPKVKK